MGIFNNNLEIDIDNPFKDDQLQREEEIRNLTALFDIVDNQMVLAINSQWGTGKTTFLKMWNQYLKNDGYKTIFFNAWENDYVEEPFIAFVDEIRESINDENKIRGFMEKAKDVGLALVKQSPKMLSKAIKSKTGFDSEEIISDDEVTQIISDKINNYNKHKKSIDKFKKELEKIAFKEFEENKKPMIIFVDELDRCRPDYAINLLERIKHFFNVQNIIFVLGIDKEALSNSIKVIYGEQIDVNGYLAKFIDLEYRIKCSSIQEYIEYLLGKYGFEEMYKRRRVEIGGVDEIQAEYNYDRFRDAVVRVVAGFQLPLRDIEKLLVEIYMILKSNIYRFVFPYRLLILCTIKRINKLLYNRLKNSSITYKELKDNIEKQKLGATRWLENLGNGDFKACLIWLLNDNAELEKIKHSADNVEEHLRFMNNDCSCIKSYEWICEITSFCENDEEDVNCTDILYEMVELYDNFTMINGQ